MSNETRNRIAYWFFLIVGMAGIVIFTYEFFISKIVWWEWIFIVSAFSVFMWKPTMLVDVFNGLVDAIKSKLK